MTYALQQCTHTQTHTSHVFHITLRLYEEDAVLCVQLQVLLLGSEWCHAVLSNQPLSAGQPQPQRLHVPLALSITLKDKNTLLPLSLILQLNPPFPPRVHLVLPMQQTKMNVHTRRHTLLSPLCCQGVISQFFRDKEGGKTKEKKKLNEELEADQRCKNASVYLLLARKVVMMRTEPNIHGQHMETQ